MEQTKALFQLLVTRSSRELLQIRTKTLLSRCNSACWKFTTKECRIYW
jgi:hypothetical protein